MMIDVTLILMIDVTLIMMIDVTLIIHVMFLMKRSDHCVCLPAAGVYQ